MTEASESTSLEYERERVPDHALKGPASFWGMYAGEHTAGTEFMIGPLFLAAGASLQDLVLGLLLGNVLAVLTWRYLVTPIAMAKRLTLYYQLERIAGTSLVKLYNLVNGVLFCFLAGAMITVSAAAVGVPFGILFSVPENTFGFAEPAFTVLVVIVGIIIAIVAAAGYEMVSRVANIAAPWMIAVFIACGIVALGQMGMNSIESLREGAFWSDAIAFVRERNGPTEFSFPQIVIFAWLCNSAMHFGMADLSIFRFARDKASGWAPSIGMFLGHYVAWIAAGLLLAAQIKLLKDTSANPGALAWNAMGWTGIICVVIAGWTTANPTIYRSGLAFQGIFPRSSRIAMTLLAGGVATIAGLFPNLSAKLLGFVGLYGTILGPMGAILFVDHYWMKRLGLPEEWAMQQGAKVNIAVLIAWLAPVGVSLYLIYQFDLFAAYAVVPAWIASGILYITLTKLLNKLPAADFTAKTEG